MSIELYLAFAAATTVLMLIPGPNVALIVANSLAYGVRFGLLTVAGTSSAMVLQLALTLIGMTAVLSFLSHWFEALRWIGVAYLLYLGWRSWHAAAADLAGTRAEPRSPRGIYFRGFLVSLANPKTLLFYGAFLPQFVSDKAERLPQLLLLAATFLALALFLDSLWAVAASRARRLIAGHGRLPNRVTGGLLMGAGVGLALAHKS